jgi:hypothetical protein
MSNPGWPFGQPRALIRYPIRVARAIPENTSGTGNIPSESGSTQHLYRTRNKGIFVLLSPAILFFPKFCNQHAQRPQDEHGTMDCTDHTDARPIRFIRAIRGQKKDFRTKPQSPRSFLNSPIRIIIVLAKAGAIFPHRGGVRITSFLEMTTRMSRSDI